MIEEVGGGGGGDLFHPHMLGSVLENSILPCPYFTLYVYFFSKGHLS